jgi:hypothetical protein
LTATVNIDRNRQHRPQPSTSTATVNIDRNVNIDQLPSTSTATVNIDQLPSTSAGPGPGRDEGGGLGGA